MTLAGSTAAQTVIPGAPLFVVAYGGVSLTGVQSNVIVDGGFETEGSSNAASPTPIPAISGKITSNLIATTSASFTVGATPRPRSATGANGICQTFVVPASGVLTLFVNEGGDESAGFGDQEATLFTGSQSALALAAPSPIPVFNELNANVPTATSSPAAFVKKGQFALTLAPPMGFLPQAPTNGNALLMRSRLSGP